MPRFSFDWDFFFGGIANVGIAIIAAANVAVFLNQKSSTGLFLYRTKRRENMDVITLTGVTFIAIGIIGIAIRIYTASRRHTAGKRP